MARTRSLRTPAIGADALQLFGVITHDATAPLRIAGTESVPLRDLVAIVRSAPYERLAATSEAIEEYRRIVEDAFRVQPVIPAPFGTVFRSRSSLLHWMELHYTTLMDALVELGDRVMARVRVAPLPLDAAAMTETREGRAADFETTVFDSFRFLKRSATACVTFAPQQDPHGRSVEASFLVEREKWGSFRDAVREERERLPEMAIEHSQPLPPYDFVRLQFGA
ncbi:MAG TPA: GvpL/GvpF family gas vesicle protein [Gemmatimonadaceae bacterium]|nr:GvpL/GvpF family gas vesicle protein [Gemmatimonadaceae bacterium]